MLGEQSASAWSLTISIFKPWVCVNQHRLEIEDVTFNGSCKKCGAEVVCRTTPEDARKAIGDDSFAPRRLIKINGRWYKEIENECLHCTKLYKTPYKNSRYCSRACKKSNLAERQQRKQGNVYCLFCGELIKTFDKRIRFCGAPCRMKMRNP